MRFLKLVQTVLMTSLLCSCTDDALVVENGSSTSLLTEHSTGSTSAVDPWATGNHTSTSGEDSGSGSNSFSSSIGTALDEDIPCNSGQAQYYDDYGKGTEKNPYQICNGLQLLDLAKQDQNQEALRAWYVLKKDISLSEINENIQIAKDPAHPFEGVFDGNEKSMQGLSNKSSNGGGLFRHVGGGARIYKLKLFNSHVQFSKNAGILIDQLKNFHGLLENITVEVGHIQQFPNTSFFENIGAVVGTGKIENAVIRNLKSRFSMNFDLYDPNSLGNRARCIGGLFGSLENIGLDEVTLESLEALTNSSISISSTQKKNDLSAAGIGGMVGCARNLRFVSSTATMPKITVMLHPVDSDDAFSVIGGMVGEGKNLTFSDGLNAVIDPVFTANTGGSIGGFAGRCVDCTFEGVLSSGMHASYLTLSNADYLKNPIGTHNKRRVGGLVGSHEKGTLTIERSSTFNFRFTVSQPQNMLSSFHWKYYTMGGLVGNIAKDATLTKINESYAVSSLNSPDDNTTYKGIQVTYGGLMGEIDSGNTQVSLEDSFAVLRANIGVQKSGGLIGAWNPGSDGFNTSYVIRKSYAVGKVAVTNYKEENSHGGLVNTLQITQPLSTITDSWASILYTQETSGNLNFPEVGGIIGRLQKNAYNPLWDKNYENIENVAYSPVFTASKIDLANEKYLEVTTCISTQSLNKFALQDIQGCKLINDHDFQDQTKFKARFPAWDFINVWEYGAKPTYLYPTLKAINTKPQ